MAQAMVPPTGMDDANKPMPMVERMQRRFPQPVRVGDLVGLPVLDNNASTLGYVRQVVHTAAGKIELIVAYNKWFGWFGWFTRPVAVPIEVVGIEGRQLVVARHARQRIRHGADLAEPGCNGAAGRRDDPNRAGPQLTITSL